MLRASALQFSLGTTVPQAGAVLPIMALFGFFPTATLIFELYQAVARLLVDKVATNDGRKQMDKFQHAMLENQLMMGEAMWMILHQSPGKDNKGALDHISARVAETRRLLDEDKDTH
jgi:hypothetical protein